MEWRKEEVREFPMTATQTTNIRLKNRNNANNNNNKQKGIILLNKGIIILIIIYNIHENLNERLGSKMVERSF